jgi:hypothetical protein
MNSTMELVVDEPPPTPTRGVVVVVVLCRGPGPGRGPGAGTEVGVGVEIERGVGARMGVVFADMAGGVRVKAGVDVPGAGAAAPAAMRGESRYGNCGRWST